MKIDKSDGRGCIGCTIGSKIPFGPKDAVCNGCTRQRDTVRKWGELKHEAVQETK